MMHVYDPSEFTQHTDLVFDSLNIEMTAIRKLNELDGRSLLADPKRYGQRLTLTFLGIIGVLPRYDTASLRQVWANRDRDYRRLSLMWGNTVGLRDDIIYRLSLHARNIGSGDLAGIGNTQQVLENIRRQDKSSLTQVRVPAPIYRDELVARLRKNARGLDQ